MQLQRLIDLSDITDAETLATELLVLANSMDFGLVLAMAIQEVPGEPNKVLRFGNTPSAFQAESVDLETSARDPFLKRIRSSSVPVIYDQDLYVREGVADLWEQQAPFGYKTGIAVTLHLPGSRRFVMSMDREAPLPAGDNDRMVRMLGDLQLLTVHAQTAAMRLLSETTEITLTPREQLVMQLTIAGKGNKEIARELNTSPDAVKFHITNIMKKMKTNKRLVAAQKAQALGLVS